MLHGCMRGCSGFFNENHPEQADDTSEEFHGNIVLNYGSRYGANLDWVASGSRNMVNNIFWDSVGGYFALQGPGTAASVTMNNTTIGAMRFGNEGSGSAVSIGPSVPNTVRNSIFANNFHGVEGRLLGRASRDRFIYPPNTTSIIPVQTLVGSPSQKHSR